MAVAMRCVRPDQSGITITFHYLTDGTVMARFTVRRQEFFLPAVLLLKALVDTSDREVYIFPALNCAELFELN
jgi:DNA-directed RNA polymerase I subunit RPA2